METGCQNIQLCVVILKVAFPPQMIGPMFLFPLIYITLQCTEALLLALCFRCYQTFKSPAEGKCHSCLCVFVEWAWVEGSDEHVRAVHTFAVTISLFNSGPSLISPFSCSDTSTYNSVDIKQEAAKHPWRHRRWHHSAEEGNEELNLTDWGCSDSAPSLSQYQPEILTQRLLAYVQHFIFLLNQAFTILSKITILKKYSILYLYFGLRLKFANLMSNSGTFWRVWMNEFIKLQLWTSFALLRLKNCVS